MRFRPIALDDRRKTFCRFLSALALAGICIMPSLSRPAQAHEPEAPARVSHPEDRVPLHDDLGKLSYPITTKSELAQQYFDQGLRLTYAFNHAEALRSYREAQRHDPACAMCYWGEAFALGPNINAGIEEGAENPAVRAIAQARKLAAGIRQSERALIDALAKRYSVDPKTDRSVLNRAYADAMAEAVRRFPEDDEIAVFFMDALMNLSPWDYWEADGKTPKGRIGEAIRTAEKVLVRNPGHVGAIHLYIHLTEASAAPERAEPYANRLAKLMPGAGHIVHMGAHTFYRVGRYKDSMTINQDAVKVDERYIARTKAKGIYPGGYYPHNIHFVVVSAQMAGDAKTALAYAERLAGKVPEGLARKIGWLQPILQAPYFAHAQFSEPETILALPDPGEQFPFVRAAWLYARGVAYAFRGDVEKTRTEAARLAELNHRANGSYPPDLAPVAQDVLRIARHVLEGRIAQVRGDKEAAIREFRTAASIQDALPYTEPPFWYYPVRQSLGAALLAAGRAREAEQTFRQSLQNFPRNGWALYGLMRAQQAQGREVDAAQTGKLIKKAWAGKPELLSLGRL